MENDLKGSKNSYSTTSKSYKAFLACILRQKSKPLNPNLLVNLYLDCFLLFNKKICAPTVIDAGLCDENKFTEWRKEQKRAGNLDWDSKSFGEKTTYDYKIGPKLLKYIGKVSDEHGLGASKAYVDMKIDEVRSELQMVKNGLDELIELFDPPVTDAKRTVYYPHPARLFSIKTHQSRILKVVDDDDDDDLGSAHPDYSKSLDS